jgi:radical SAM superfamily enzyme YgiQ (UPF0313 family)
MSPQIILLSDFTDPTLLTKSIGVYKVAYELRSAGYDVAVINHLHCFSYEEILHILKNLVTDRTLFIGVSNGFYKDISYLKETKIMEFYKFHKDNLHANGFILPHGRDKNTHLIIEIKKINPNVKFVLGGPSAQDFAFNKDFDYVVPGYADLSIVNLADHLLKKKALKSYYKSIFGPIIVTDPKADGFDFSRSTMKYNDEDCVLDAETLQIEISRGCIFKCAFCGYPLNGKKKFDYIKDEELLYNEFLDNFKRFKITRYIFSDDTFNDSVEKCQMIYRISKKLPFKLEYWAFLRLDLIAAHPETIDLIFGSGCKAGFFGVESFNPKTQSIIGKGMKKEKQLPVLDTIKEKYGNSVSLHGAFIIGLPEEDINSIYSTIEYLVSDDCHFDSWSLSPLSINFGGISSFLSDIDKNWEKYGYEKTENNKWKNKYLDYSKALELTEYAVIKASQNKTRGIGGGIAIQLSGHGLDLNIFLNKTREELDYNMILNQKTSRFETYRKKLYSVFNITEFKN